MLGLLYDRSTFWKHSCYETPLPKRAQYFSVSNLRKLQVEHISFEPQMHEDAFQVPQQLPPLRMLGKNSMSSPSIWRACQAFLREQAIWPAVEHLTFSAQASKSCSTRGIHS